MNDVIAGDGFSTNFALRLLGTPGGRLGIARAVRWREFQNRGGGEVVPGAAGPGGPT